jgi:Ni,Fe-hydrogenase I large subunit
MENNIEAYLRNELSSFEKAAFEQEMAQNPNLSQEVLFQKDLIQTIQQNRRMELKARLQNVQTPSLKNNRNYINIAAVLTGVVITSIGAYYIWNQNTNNTTTTNLVKKIPVSAIETTNTTNKVVPVATLTKTSNTITNQKDTPNNNTPTKTKTIGSKTSNNQSSNTQLESSTLNEVEMVNEHNIDFSVNELNVPTLNNSASSKSNQIQNIDIKEIKDTNLGYTYYNNQLYLFGDFGNNPYELVELNLKQKKHLYIAMNDKFYELIQGKSTFTRFVAITDKTIVQQLTVLKNQH